MILERLQIVRRALAALLFILAALGATSSSRAQIINWPLKPEAQPHPLGNNYGEYQNYGGVPYLHPGIDILGNAYDSVFAVESGYVKAVLTTSAEYHWRVAIGDSAAPVACNGYLYAHLDSATIQVAEGDTVTVGQYLGRLVAWPVADFHHLHFVQIRQTGYPWSADWLFIHNPLDYLVNVTDLDAPEFLPLVNGSYFAFAPNNQTTYLPVGDTLSGAVDIHVSVRDLVGHPTWQLTPYRLQWEFWNDSTIYGPFLSVQFRDTLWWTANVTTIYRDDPTYDTKGDYDNREYYMILTNNDNDEYIEDGDADSAWFTGDYPNGTYWVKAAAIDRYGNRAEESLQVTIENVLTFSGTVQPADFPSSWAGSEVRLPQLGLVDSTDSAGYYEFPNLGPGTYSVEVSHTYYDSIQTDVRVTARSPSHDFLLQPNAGLRGDLNHSGSLEAADIIALVAYVFKSGPEPEPPIIGDVNGIPPTTSADIIYLVNHVFKSGPPPPPL